MLARIGLRPHGDALWLVSGMVLVVTIAGHAVTAGLGIGALALAPLLYSRDAISHAALIRQMVDGNPFAGDRLGYPFAFNWLDWPSLDWGLLGITKLLALFTQDHAVIFNVLFLLGFPAAFVSAYLVGRKFDLTPSFAFVAGLSFSLASYHFERLSLHGHLFLTWYWVAPVYVLLGWRLIQPVHGSARRATLHGVGLAVMTGFGVYYTAFGLITVTAALLYALAVRPMRDALRDYLAFIIPIVFGVCIQVLPTLANRLINGNNPLAFSRSTLESEIWALRPVQLLLPHISHRVPGMAEKAKQFQDLALQENESVMSSVGAIASLGLWVLLITAITAIAGKPLDARLRFLIVLGLALLAFATIGGMGMFVAMLGITEIRSWNRLSIFLQFAGLMATMIALQPTFGRFSARARRALAPFALVVAVAIVWVDQTPATSARTLPAAIEQRQATAAFVRSLEARLPRGAAIYQLPFQGYPEAWLKPHYDAYDFMKPFLESRFLRFNLGGMKGRSGDRFYRALAQQPLETQVRVARELGFAGIYIDRLGLRDYGTGTIRELNALLGEAAATYRSDRRVVYFDLRNTKPALTPGSVTPGEAIARTGFVPRFAVRPRGD